MAEETNTGENKSTRKDLSWIETIKENWKLKTENLRYYWLRIWGKSTKQSLVVVEELKQRSNAKSMKLRGVKMKIRKIKIGVISSDWIDFLHLIIYIFLHLDYFKS